MLYIFWTTAVQIPNILFDVVLLPTLLIRKILLTFEDFIKWGFLVKLPSSSVCKSIAAETFFFFFFPYFTLSYPSLQISSVVAQCLPMCHHFAFINWASWRDNTLKSSTYVCILWLKTPIFWEISSLAILLKSRLEHWKTDLKRAFGRAVVELLRVVKPFSVSDFRFLFWSDTSVRMLECSPQIY